MNEIIAELNLIGDKLVPVAGLIMQLACQDPFIHEPDCNCRKCQAFLAVHDCQNRLEKIVKQLRQL